ncbi:DUF1206 domain-containing protein, partial [Nocardioides sp.]|uniref:DUF1206 domain-containing protein n=1 Tax=Nocardioides sp. TaxID=35761 RepID=UPI00321AC17F
MSQSTAHQAHQSDLVDRIAGVGLVAYGVVHLLIGWLAVTLAVGDRQGGASSTGAVKQLAQQPYGEALVWLIAVGMILLVLWRLIEAALGYRDKDGKLWLFQIRPLVRYRETEILEALAAYVGDRPAPGKVRLDEPIG